MINVAYFRRTACLSSAGLPAIEKYTERTRVTSSAETAFPRLALSTMHLKLSALRRMTSAPLQLQLPELNRVV